MSRGRATLLVLLGGLALSARAGAAEWAFEPALALNADYSDNPRLQIDPDKAALGAIVEATAQLAWRTESLAVTARPRVRVARYSDYELLDTDDRSLDLGLVQGFEEGQVALSLRAVRDHTLTSELETTGFVEANRPREYYHAAADGQWQASTRLVLGAGLAYDAANFEPDPLRLLVDYQYPSLSLYARRTAGERTAITLTGSAGSLRGAQIVAESNDYALRVGLEHTWTERWQSSFSIGPSRVVPREGPAAHGLVYSAEITHNDERTRWQLSGLREQRATGRGVLENREEVAASASRLLTETWSGRLALRVIRSEASYRGLFSGGQRTYGRAEAGLTWRWSPQWTANLGYVYSRQRYEFLGPEPSGHQLSAGVAWSGWRQARSR